MKKIILILVVNLLGSTVYSQASFNTHTPELNQDAPKKLYVSFKAPIQASSGQSFNEAIALRIPDFKNLVAEFSFTTKKADLMPEATLQRLEDAARYNTGSSASVAKLRNIYQLTLNDADNQKLDKLVNALQQLNEVEYCSLAASSQQQRPPYDIAPATPVFQTEQKYPSSQGINMHAAHNLGYSGQGINIRDVEYGFNAAHEELNEVNAHVTENMTVSPNVTPDWAEHGTAVFGIVYADSGDYGITGLAHGASEMVLYPEYTVSGGYDRVAAVSKSISDSSEGDIIIFEIQVPGAQGNYGPGEYDPLIWDLTRAATDAGIIVVAAAGNGSENLDAPAYSGYMNRGNSGAIMVGAGSSDNLHNRLQYSTYGSRVDLQGWGENVFTSGFGDAMALNNDANQYYTNFSGTSAATAIVASCVAVLQSYYHDMTGGYMNSQQIKELLVSTGFPQGNSASGKIGPLPDMGKAMGTMKTPELSIGDEVASTSGAFQIYPNPVADILSVKLPNAKDATIEIYNSVGQRVYAGTLGQQINSIPVNSLSQGMYIVKINNQGRQISNKIVKR